MTTMTLDESRFKILLEETRVKILSQRKGWLSNLLVEAIEDASLVVAIKEGEQSEIISRDDIFALLKR